MAWFGYVYLLGFAFGLVLTIVSYMSGGGGPVATTNGQIGIANERSWRGYHLLIGFLTWFGAAGFVALALGLDGWLSLPLAIVAGIVAAVWMRQKLIRHNPFDVAPFENEPEGRIARVCELITPDTPGKVLYISNGERHAAPAHGLSGQVFEVGQEVVIIQFQNGLAKVESLDKVLATKTS